MISMNITDGGFYNSSIQKSLQKPIEPVDIDDTVIDFSQSAEDNNQDENDINVIAHRGYSSIAPENTIPAFVEAEKNCFLRKNAQV